MTARRPDGRPDPARRREGAFHGIVSGGAWAPGRSRETDRFART